MGTEMVVIAVIAAFILSFSLLLNIVLLIASGAMGWLLNNSMKNIQRLDTELTELDSQLIMSDSINDILEQVINLRDELFEISQMDMYTGEPVITGLMDHINSTLEKIESSVIKQEYMRSLEQKNE